MPSKSPRKAKSTSHGGRGKKSSSPKGVRVARKVMTPTIVNEESTFVVVTYWWGRDRENRNSQRPCPEEMEEGTKLTKQPTTYDAMIREWEECCAKVGCNYMAVEYPEFAKKGGYQKAINFKATFIIACLKACYPRKVLYIDGDMKVNRYPKIFDIQDVDHMAHGWNIDGRAGEDSYDDPNCYNPYLYETSGGTMFFSQGKAALDLLKLWQEGVKKNPGKSDDRILSLMFNRHKCLLAINTIQLPIEYLWFTMDYNHEVGRNRSIFIEHPQCLTGEDRASSMGSGVDRQPARYDHEISDKMTCRLKNVPLYEFVMFPSAALAASMRPYIDYLKEKDVIQVVPYSERYGDYNAVVQKNKELARAVSIPDRLSAGNTLVITSKYTDKFVCVPSLGCMMTVAEREVIPTLLAALEMGINVLYVPKHTGSKAAMARITKVKKLAKGFGSTVELVARNRNHDIKRFKKEYTLKLDREYPMFFRASSDVLRHLVRMSSSWGEFEKLFNTCFTFISMIRCVWG